MPARCCPAKVLLKLNHFTGNQRVAAVQEGRMCQNSLCCILSAPHNHGRCHLCSWENRDSVCSQPLYMLPKLGMCFAHHLPWIHLFPWKVLLTSVLGCWVFVFIPESRACRNGGTIMKESIHDCFQTNQKKNPANSFSLIYFFSGIARRIWPQDWVAPDSISNWKIYLRK